MRPLCLLLASLAFAGCSTVKLAYNQADWLLVRYADDYVELDGGQRERFESQLRAYLNTHRTERLPEYRVFLETAGELATDGLTPRDTDGVFASLRLLYRTTVADTAPLVAALLASLAPSQVDRLARKLSQSNREYARDYLSGSEAERRQARFRRATERVERWTGRLTREQRKLLSRLINSFPDIAHEWFDYRISEQAGLLKLLRAGAGHDEILSYLLDWWAWQRRQPSRLQEKGEQWNAALKRLIVALDTTLTTQQRRRLLRRLDRLANDLSELADQARTPTASIDAPLVAPQLASRCSPQSLGQL